MAEAPGKHSGNPISEITTHEAESFLGSLMCLPKKTESDGTFFLHRLHFTYF